MVQSIGTELQSHLSSGYTTTCWCCKVVRVDGVKLGFTDHDRDLSINGVLYEASSGITASEIQSSLGLNVDNLEVQGALRSDSLSEDDISVGKYDNAAVYIYMVNWNDVSQRVLIKSGNIGEIRRNNNIFECEFRGLSAKLQQNIGRVYKYNCDALLGDNRCKKNISGSKFTGSLVIDRVYSKNEIRCNGINAYELGWFSNGLVTWTSGLNIGLSMDIKSHTENFGKRLFFWEGAVYDLKVGDTATVSVGCNKVPNTCRDVFNNMINYRGFSQMPGNDFLISYPTQDDASLDGSVI